MGTRFRLQRAQSQDTHEPFLSRDLSGAHQAALRDHSGIKIHTQGKSVNTSFICMGRATVVSSDRISLQGTSQQ